MHPLLVQDQWDTNAEHIAYFRHGDMIATVRIVSVQLGRLPFNDYATITVVQGRDFQIGRFVASNRRPTDVRFVYEHVVNNLFTAYPVIYVAAAAGGPISLDRYIDRLGFADTGLAYSDSRYGRTFKILCRENRGDFI